MQWPRFRRARETPDPATPALRMAESQVRDLEERAHRVVGILQPRHDRNHWSETVDELWRGRPA